MTRPSASARATALHRRALDAAVEADAPRPAHRPRPASLPSGAGVLALASVGLALGLAATAVAVGRGWDPGAVAAGPWVTQPRIGTPGIDPYAQAVLARTGRLPMAAAEGLSFEATVDSTGYRLLRSCSYRVSGDRPPARFWTLTATGPEGATVDDRARRSGFSSTSVIRDEAGRAAIEVGPEARPGNWLPLSGQGPLVLTLRLYDTPLTGKAGEIAGATLPAIERQGCGGGAP